MKSFFAVLFACLSMIQALGQTALIPDTPVPPPSPSLVPGGPAIAPNPGTVVTNATLVSLSSSLAALQNSLQQTLPVLAIFNDGFDFVSLSDKSLGVGPSVNPSGNFSGSMATNFAGNFGVNFAVSTGNPLITTSNRMPAPAVAGVSQGLAGIPVSRDTLRALLVLQSEIQEMLPLVNALNGGTTNFAGNFTNVFGIVQTSP